MTDSKTIVCPFCRSPAAVPIGGGSDESSVGVCPHCGMPHHVACWNANGGCTTFKCPHSPQTSGFVAAAMQNVHAVGSRKRGAVIPPEKPSPATPTPSRPAWLKLVGGLAAAAVVVVVLWSNSQPSQPGPSPSPVLPTVVPVGKTVALATAAAVGRPALGPTQLVQPTIAPAVPEQASPVAKVNVDTLNVRSGPGTEYTKTDTLHNGDKVPIVGRNADWWQVQMPQGDKGWIHGDFVEVVGSTSAVAVVRAPTLPPSPIPTPPPTARPTARAAPTTLASNRSGFSGNQGEGGWTYLMEDGRNSGRFRPLPRYDGRCWRTDNWENDVRICAEGEIHPGQSTRVAYQWRVSAGGQRKIEVHAHKIDTRCGDGVWVGTFRVVDDGSGPRKLGDFTIGGGDNQGNTVTYSDYLDAGNLILVLVDIRGDSTCDMTRLNVEVR